jgi:hypothetical protein
VQFVCPIFGWANELYKKTSGQIFIEMLSTKYKNIAIGTTNRFDNQPNPLLSYL